MTVSAAAAAAAVVGLVAASDGWLGAGESVGRSVAVVVAKAAAGKCRVCGAAAAAWVGIGGAELPPLPPLPPLRVKWALIGGGGGERTGESCSLCPET